MSDFLSYWRARPFFGFLVLGLALTGVRLAVLIGAEAGLGPDEAQYWAWSLEPAFGYYSKPPFIAWTIAATAGAFGEAEWAIRFAAPFFHLGAAIFIFLLGRRLYDGTIAFWAASAWLVLPGVALSALLITTDAPLLFFWSAALYCFFRMTEASGRSLGWAVALGTAIGLGFLSKYAMAYFGAGAVLAFFIAPDVRAGMKWRDGLVALLVAAAIIAPNLLWNAANEFRTIAHTAANADWGASPFHPLKLAEFLVAQAGVFGPIAFALLVWGLATLGKRLAGAGPARSHDLALLAFALPPLAIVSFQALISRAHANWAAAAFPAALLLVTAWAFRAKLGWLKRASLALNLAVAGVLLAGIAEFGLADALRAGRAVAPLRNWQATGAAIAGAATGYDAVLVDDRKLMSGLLFYARGGPPIVSWNSNNKIENHYEAFMAFDPAAARRVLFVSVEDSARAVAPRFSEIRRIGEVATPLGPGEARRLYLFEISGYEEVPAGPPAPSVGGQ